MSIESPLSMYDIVVNTVAGSVTLFVFLFIGLLSYMGARFQMPKSIFLVCLGLFGIMFSGYIGGLYLIIILVSGFAIFMSLARSIT